MVHNSKRQKPMARRGRSTGHSPHKNMEGSPNAGRHRQQTASRLCCDGTRAELLLTTDSPTWLLQADLVLLHSTDTAHSTNWRYMATLHWTNQHHFPAASAHFACHILVIFATFQTFFSILLYVSWWSVNSDGSRYDSLKAQMMGLAVVGNKAFLN